MTIRNLQFLMAPRSVAIIGASPKEESIGQIVLRNIHHAGFKGSISAVNPRYREINGITCHASVETLPNAPDLAIITTPPDSVAGLVGALGERGTRAVVIITAGFGEGGQEIGVQRRQAVLNAARPHLLRVVGPNCFGVILPKLGLNASFSRVSPSAGDIAFVTQSGAMMAELLDWASPRGIGFSAAVSLGDMIDVDFGDMLDWLCSDINTKAILLYVEAITHPRKFMSAARAAARIKPVIVIKSGRHAASAKAATSHTGALAGSDAVYDAAFARAGILRVRTVQQLFDAATLISIAPRLRGERLAIITNGGGAGVIATDELFDRNGKLAELSPATLAKLDASLPTAWSHGNPVDVIGDADYLRYSDAITDVMADSNVDAILVMHCPTAVVDPCDAANAVIRAPKDKPILTAWLGDSSVQQARARLAAHGIPTFPSAAEAIDGFTSLIRHARHQDMLMQAPRSGARIPATKIAEAKTIIADCRRDGRGWMLPVKARQLLALYGIPMGRCIDVATPGEAAEAAAKIGSAVALKIRSPDIVHKSDVGGVVLNLGSPEAVRLAATEMLERIAHSLPDARLEGFLVEEMILRPRAYELLVGMTIDPTFGPVIAFGHGGTAVEVINDKALGLPPLNGVLADAMIKQTRVGRLLEGYRDRPAANMEAVADTLVALSQMVADHPELTDIDINPLLADENGVLGIDVRIRLAAAQDANRLVICPYPSHLERTANLPGGRTVVIRPIRPEDEEALRALVAGLTLEDRRFRFFAPRKELDHQLAALLTQIDYDREMAVLAFPDDGSDATPWGVGRIHADPDNQRAEFALTVRSDRKDLGLGSLLLQTLLEVARERGIGEIWGDVLADNTRMLDLCERTGFTRSTRADDPKVIRVARNL